MRRTQCAVTDPQVIERVLKRATVGRLATLGVDGYPYITPVNYTYYHGSVYFHCARKGEKTDNILRDPRVCFEVDIPLAYLGTDFDPHRPVCQVHQFYHSVVIRGIAEIVEDTNEKVTSLNAMMASLENDPEFNRITAKTPAVAMCSVVAIRIESISAKSDLAQKKSAEERQNIAEYLERKGGDGNDEAAALIRSGFLAY